MSFIRKIPGSFKRELEDYKVLLRSIPSLNITLFVVSVIAMNLLANKELFSTPWLALDCGFTLSWISFLCMDMICKHFGAKPAVKISILALAINLLVCGLFKLMSLTPGMWGEFYSTEMTEVNDALNATFGGSWYVVLGSSTAMLVSALVNAVINALIGKRLTNDSFKPSPPVHTSLLLSLSLWIISSLPQWFLMCSSAGALFRCLHVL